jgi:hypothetical protein
MLAPEMMIPTPLPLTIDDGVSPRVVLAVTVLCLVGSMIFWFAVF